jgi:hypothetical protein
MNWEAITAVSELVAAIAVVISLIYIAVQVRSGASAFRTSIRDTSFHALMEFNYALSADESCAWIFQRCVSDWDSLEDRERVRALQLMFSFLKMFENMYLHYLDGLVEEEMWTSNKEILLAYATQPGCQKHLSQRMPVFHPEYQKLLRTMEASTIVTVGEISQVKTESAA